MSCQKRVEVQQALGHLAINREEIDMSINEVYPNFYVIFKCVLMVLWWAFLISAGVFFIKETLFVNNCKRQLSQDVLAVSIGIYLVILFVSAGVLSAGH